MRNQTSNLAAQFNDIGVQLAGGTSPFQIALQQGTQINQALGSAGAGATVKALGGAFLSLLNPVSLATIAIIAGGGYAAQYFLSVVRGSEKSAETLKQEAELIQKVAQEWGDALPEVKAYAEARAKALDQDRTRQATNLTIGAYFENAKSEVDKLGESITDLLYQMGNRAAGRELFADIEKKFAAVKTRIDEGGDSTKQIQELQKALNAAYEQMPIPLIEKISGTVERLARGWADVAKRADEARISQQKHEEVDIYDPRDPRFQGPTGPLPRTAPVPTVRPSFEDIGQSIDSINSAINGFVQRVDKAEGRGKNPASSASGVGQFIESTWLDLFRKYYPEQAASLSRDAILDLRKNADVSYALIKAYAAENAKVLQAAGVHVDEAALQLAHFLGAGDAAKVLNAAPGTPLAGLISSKSIAANPTILGGGRTVDDAIAYAQRRANASVSEKSPGDIFQGNMDQIQRRIDLINAEYEAQAKLNPLIKDYGYQVEYAKAKQDLLNDAQKAGIEVTPELAEKIDILAQNYAKAKVARDQLTESQRMAASAAREGSEFGKDVLGGFIQDLRAGKDASDALADALGKVADKLLDVALNDLFGLQPGGNGTGGPLSFLGSLFGFLFRASGGPIHGPGGPKGDKIPTMLSDGEYIVNSEATRKNRALLDAINFGGLTYRAGGGAMSGPPASPIIRSSASRSGGGDYLAVDGTFKVVNGNLVPLVTNVSGVVAGRQVKSANRALPGRLASQQARGV
ncbi:phage tail length tape measure family protein [Aquamicrobium soli]|uniref:Phage tail length tape measure family protein n=1 Tax=Aquamicrobium soli TaxID=1811518 RepID=A0ABV7KHH2_9HYPH